MNLELMAVVSECLKNDELVNQYCRLNNIKRPDRLSPIDKMIDEACGVDAGKEFIEGFIKFVDEFIYRLVPPTKTCSNCIDETCIDNGANIEPCAQWENKESTTGLAENMKRIREEKGITLEQVAEHMNVTTRTLKTWENGKVGHLDTKQIIKLAEVLGTTPHVLAGWVEE